MQEIPNEKKIIVVGRKRSKKKYLLILAFLLLILISIVLISIMLLPEDVKNDSVRPSAIPTITSTVTVSPTVGQGGASPSPTESLVNNQKYIFPDCEIELMADSKWIPSTTGYLATCGILSTEEITNFTNITDFDGTLIAILPFLSDSPFAPEKQTKYDEYLQKMDKDSKRYSPTRDFLYSREDYQVDFRPAVITEIYNSKLGQTKQLFYTGFRGEYIILWGGKTSDTLDEDVMTVIRTIKFRQSLPGED